MAPKKKAPPKNAFYFYMLDYKEKATKRGECFPGGLKDVSYAASPSWETMSQSQKAPYFEKAKAYKAQTRGDPEMKYTTTGVSYAEVDMRIREEEERYNTMITYIENEIHNLTNKAALSSKLFYLVHVNWYCITNSQIYLPAEIAIVEFSLKSGISREYHTFVNPGPPPIGYQLSAIEHIEQTHQTPLGFEKGDRSFSKMLHDIINFIKVGGSEHDLPALYTMSDSINHNTSISAVKSTLQMLCENENSEDTPEFRVYVLDKLFYKLRNECAKYSDDTRGFPTLSIPLMELEKEIFSDSDTVTCDYHLQIDRGSYCSLSKVKGWAFLICDYCCQDLGIDIIPGLHCPELVDRRYLNKKKTEYRPDSPELQKKEQGKFGFNKKKIDGNAWVQYGADEKDDNNGAWGPPISVASRPGTLASVVSSAPSPPSFCDKNFPAIGQTPSNFAMDYSENSFPAVGRGRRKNRNVGRNIDKLVPNMQSMNLEK